MALTATDLQVDQLEQRLGVIGKQAAKCEAHGDYIAVITKYSDRASGCPTCAEQARVEREAIQQQEDRARFAQERLERRLGASLIPPRFAGKDFASYRAATKAQRDTLKLCQGYAEHFPAHYDAGRCLLMVGNVGAGKTHLASAIATQIIRQHGALAVYRTLHSLMQYVKGSYDNESGYSEAQAFERLVEPHLLIIDEIGATKQTEFEQATLFNVINGRYEQQKPTIVISNLMPDELSRALGDRAVDRLRENDGIWLVFSWGSARKEAAHD